MRTNIRNINFQQNNEMDIREYDNTSSSRLVAWHSSNAFHPINKVTLRWDGLVLGWVTACGQVNHLGM